MFLSATDTTSIAALAKTFPMFLPICQEITDFAQNPKELMNMFSEALRIMDRNLERQMVEEIRAELEAKLVAAEAKAEAAEEYAKKAIAEAKAQETARTEIFLLRLLGKSAEEISQELSLSPATVQKVLSTVKQPS